MKVTEPVRGLRAHLYVRSELPPPAREQCDAVESRLARLVDCGALESVERNEWQKRVPVEACDGAVRDIYLSATAWADEQGVRLTPFFEIRECYSSAHGGLTDWLVVPALCLAVFEDEELTAVYPHADGPTTYSVDDGVDSLVRDLLDGSERTRITAD